MADDTLHDHSRFGLHDSRSPMLVDVLAARWLGHGRAIECYLACVSALYGALLLTVPQGAYDSPATADLAWIGYGHVIALPLLAKAALTGGGLLLNILGMPYSRPLRFAGALLGTIIWIWIALKLATLGIFATTGFAFCVFAALFSVRIMGMALADLPRPGAPGVS